MSTRSMSLASCVTTIPTLLLTAVIAPVALSQQAAPSPASLLQMMSGRLPGAAAQQAAPASAAVPAPQALGPKAPGKIRIGVAPASAQMGQGSNSQQDYGTPVRNAMVLIMSGPAVEVVALDARIPIQLEAEAQQKECDYILLSNVVVKHSSGSGFSKFMKAGTVAANFTPLGMMAHTMTSMNGVLAATAATTAMQTAAQSTQQLATNQLSGFNGQIKTKDEVTVEYQLVPTGQAQAKLNNTLNGKSKSDGEDVLTPLLQQAANTVLTQVTTPTPVASR